MYELNWFSEYVNQVSVLAKSETIELAELLRAQLISYGARQSAGITWIVR